MLGHFAKCITHCLITFLNFLFKKNSFPCFFWLGVTNWGFRWVSLAATFPEFSQDIIDKKKKTKNLTGNLDFGKLRVI